MSKKEDEVFRKRQAKEGQKGGETTKAKYGSEHFAKIARKRWGKKKKNATVK